MLRVFFLYAYTNFRTCFLSLYTYHIFGCVLSLSLSLYTYHLFGGVIVLLAIIILIKGRNCSKERAGLEVSDKIYFFYFEERKERLELYFFYFNYLRKNRAFSYKSKPLRQVRRNNIHDFDMYIQFII